MTPEEFRRFALELPDAAANAHLGTPDFRVAGRIFATLAPDGATAILKFRREQQEMLSAAEPDLFSPVPGYWGRSGWTILRIGPIDEAGLRNALLMAWRNVAPKRLLAGQSP